MFRQKDGVVMGSPLGVVFANFYMGTVEERVFSNIRTPCKYARYIDDIFVQAENEEEVEAVWRTFQQCSSMNYTVEFSNEGQLPFLDVLVYKTDDGLRTSVCTKQTNLGLCRNGDSKCLARFKNTTVRAFIRRALTHCSSWQDTFKELDRVTQVLVNNGYPNRLINKEVRTTLDHWYSKSERPQPHPHEKIKLYYKARMHAHHCEDEDALRKIIRENVTPTEVNKELELVIYYQIRCTCDLIMKNNPTPPARDPFKQSNAVYQFSCPVGGYPGSYVGIRVFNMPRTARQYAALASISA
ncbi:uncharacterized protein LOC135196612 [Macrobrachium nipponense]|uniref:uncharacterized protein LOC135196612 n=1 Tax=Macrobrachium nipponense TaxID=159736 RepID=UPI0030C89131